MNTLPHKAWNYVLFVAAPLTEPFILVFCRAAVATAATAAAAHYINSQQWWTEQKNAHTKNHSNNRMRVCSACMYICVCENWMGRNKIRNQRISTNTYQKTTTTTTHLCQSKRALCVCLCSAAKLSVQRLEGERCHSIHCSALLYSAATQPFVLYNRYVKHRDIKCTR